eukprot:m.152537 g.152537  ORF g.152537 m.152537 type:complete len:1052 (-) comp16919_c0_seq1:355-3510(-)
MAVDDLASLSQLDDETVLKELKARYGSNVIYTYVGDILLAVNPFKQLPLYGKDVQNLYKGVVQKNELSPHVFFQTNEAYETLLRDKRDQCFVISGESGAGKTETTKFIVSHVIELCRAGKKTLEENIRLLNPLLEAFGNAKTVMNDNSSRFGKYLELKFDTTGAVMGAQLSEYLLEKSRVTQRLAGENNFHIFYYVLAGLGPATLASFGIESPNKLNYLAGGPSDAEIQSPENLRRFNTVTDTFKTMGFEKTDVDSVFRVLCALLLLGNTTFAAGDNDSVVITSGEQHISKAAELLEVDAKTLTKALLSSSAETKGEVISRNLNTSQAVDNRDALSKAVYARLFGWLVTTCNSTLIDPNMEGTRCLSLAILDIFGFENFGTNSLEQLCINVTNEQLQFYFNNFIFAMEQAEYEREGVTGSQISYTNNQPTLDLCVLKPRGIFHVLDEESRFPKSTDLTFTQKLASLKDHESAAYTPSRAESDLSFTITHYAGKVTYNTPRFLEKNRDTLSRDVTTCLRQSKNSLVSALFVAAINSSRGTFRVPKGQKRPPSAGNSSAKPPTVSSAFLESLQDLVKKLNDTQPHFVRCIKPNTAKKADTWTDDLVKQQLRYAGVLETVRIRKEGYSVRQPFGEFAKHYRSIAFFYHDQVAGTKDDCERIIKVAGLKNYAFGKDKVFLKYFHTDQLLSVMRVHRKAYMFVQKVCRGHIARVRYRKMKRGVTQQKSVVKAAFTMLEDVGAKVAEKIVKHIADDEREKEARAKWLAKVQKKEAELAKKEAKAEAKAAAQFSKTKAQAADGNGHVWVRNENLTMRVGKLPPHWEKKIDKATGRPYFKNHETRQTTWVDPRSAVVRKQDAKDTVGDELPYGWDEAEVDGETYYIDHTTQTTHWLHPRLLLEEKKEQYHLLQKKTEALALARRATIKEFRDKRKRLEVLRAQAADKDELEEVDSRLKALDEVISKEVGELQEISNENKELYEEISALKKQFLRKEYEAEHGEGTFEEKVQELYPSSKPIQDTMPRLDTMNKERLRQSMKKLSLEESKPPPKIPRRAFK